MRYRTRSGQDGEIAIPVSRGFGNRTLTAEEHLKKFRSNASRALPVERVEELEHTLQRLPQLSPTDFMPSLRRLHPVHNTP